MPKLAFLEKIRKNVGSCFNSFNSISIETSIKERCVWLYPSLRELLGGPLDGKCVYAGYEFNVGRFARIFDKCPRVTFNCQKGQASNSITFEGLIEGVKAKVIILSKPPRGRQAIDRIYTIGPKKGTIETING